eukprot:Lithocolla_globosa_v1_NODE_3499_length_1655_cov_10.523125.p2 type:complete len:132 gc:universal NODE_3499_length_1655_cov_10.523125:871-1266(+)
MSQIACIGQIKVLQRFVFFGRDIRADESRSGGIRAHLAGPVLLKHVFVTRQIQVRIFLHVFFVSSAIPESEADTHFFRFFFFQFSSVTFSKLRFEIFRELQSYINADIINVLAVKLREFDYVRKILRQQKN